MQELDTLLQRAIAEGVIPGAVVCVAQRDHVLWHEAYGAAALLPHWRPMQHETVFDIASLTKVVATTSLLLAALGDGLCHLDDPLQRFYPMLATAPLGTASLRMVLAHAAGLEAWIPLYQMLLPEGPRLPASLHWQLQAAVALIMQQPLAYQPGTRTLYSDLGFILLGDILEKLYQQPLDQLFHDRVACPLGLQQTAYHRLDLPWGQGLYAATEQCPWRQRMLVGEVHDENAWAMGGVAGHAGLFATALDLQKWAIACLDSAAGRCAWLPAALLRMSWQRQYISAESTRALGWDTPTEGRSSAGDYFLPKHSVGHLGFTGCSLWIDLLHQITVVFCTNRVHPSRQASGIVALRPAVHNCIMRALGVASS